jgi:hypothetical protein
MLLGQNLSRPSFLFFHVTHPLAQHRPSPPPYMAQSPSAAQLSCPILNLANPALKPDRRCPAHRLSLTAISTLPVVAGSCGPALKSSPY